MGRTARLLRGLRRDPEQLIILAVAATLAILSATDVVNDVKTLLSATLATLAILGFSIFKQSLRQDVDKQHLANLTRSADAIKRSIDEIGQTLIVSFSIGELTTPTAKRRAFEAAVQTADMWQFRGGTGSFARAWTIPAMATRARENSTGTHWRIQLQILDPQNIDRCLQYAQYRAKLSLDSGSRPQTEWTTEYVQMGCLATIFAAHWYQQHEFLTIEIRLRSEFSALRYDISPDSIIITNEDSQIPALRIPSSGEVSALYHAYRADFDLSFTSCKSTMKTKSGVRLPANKDYITEDHVFQVLRDLGIKEQVLNGLPMAALRELAVTPRNPHF
jgi:hypothetical protein